MNPIRTPSGKWRIQLSLGLDPVTGNYRRVSVTDADKNACIRKAAILMGDRESLAQNTSRMTLLSACREYISLREHTLSPWTVTTYTRFLKCLGILEKLPVHSINNMNLQLALDQYAADHSPKSTRSLFGFILTVLKQYVPSKSFSVRYPAKERPSVIIPDTKQVTTAVDLVSDPSMRVAICLCAFLGLRRGEISALHWSDLSGSTLTVCRAIAKGPDGSLSEKSPKTYSGYRTLPLSPAMLSLLESVRPSPCPPDGHIVPLTPDAITRRWERLCASTGISCRFYDLRHYNASIMLSLGIPDLYAMQRMGHATTNMLKTVYQHTLSDKVDENTALLNTLTDSIINK